MARCWPPLVLLAYTLCISLVRAAPADVPSAASFFVPTLPDLHQDNAHPLRIWAGHLSADPNQASAGPTDVTPHLYFVLTRARRPADKERVLFWFNGGPGCSSFDGLMMEVGPWRVDGNGGLRIKEGGWEEYTNIVYVDQPAGTGYSYTSTDKFVHELTEAADQLVVFLRNFYQVFPELKTMDTYLGGESYAGQYIPYFADSILKSDLHVPLSGAAIGNGWIDGKSQYPAYVEYAVKHGLIGENSNAHKAAQKATDRCMSEIDKNKDQFQAIDAPFCEEIMGETLADLEHTENGKRMCVNIYDVRLEDTAPACGMNWPPDLPDVTRYLGRGDVVSALHATAHQSSWTECRGRVHSELTNRHSQSSVTLLPGILEKIPVLLFAGDKDFICNYIGQENLIKALTWNGGTGLGTVQTKNWNVNSKPAGTWVTSRNLTYAKIFNASHMVGFDVPHVAHDMILRFMGANFSALASGGGGTALIPSSVGDDVKPMFEIVQPVDVGSGGTAKVTPGGSTTPEQDKAMWEAYYNAGSAAFVLLLVLVLIGTFLWCRMRRRRAGLSLPLSLPGALRSRDAEESIPLRANGDDSRMRTNGKGKARDTDEAIFDVGDSDEEDAKDGRS